MFTKLAEIKVPDVNVYYKSGNYSYNDSHTIKENIQILKNIKSKYGPYIEKWGKLLEIDYGVLLCFIAIESGGKPNLGPNSADATGLTQITRIAIREAVPKFKQITGYDLPQKIKDYINLKAPYLLKLTPSQQTLSATDMQKLSSLLKNDNEFNILMGAIQLRWLMGYLKYDNKAWLNKVVIGYNQSAYGRIKFYRNTLATTKTLVNDTKIPKETRDYLIKLLGINGYMQLMLQNKIY